MPGNYDHPLEVDGLAHSFLIHVPPEYEVGNPWPVVLVLHGGGSTPEAMVPFTGMNEQADQAGFIAVYPRGSGRVAEHLSFNAGMCCGYAKQHNVDDVRFVAALLDALVDSRVADPRRIYAAGMSNGGMMSYRLANEMADRLAAVASVAGPLCSKTCNPSRPVPVLHFHGTEDQFTPFDGGVGARSLARVKFYSVRHTIDCWVAANGCNPRGKKTLLRGTGSQSVAGSETVYTGNQPGSEVRLVVINGGGHTWPGRQPRYDYLGVSTPDIQASERIWEFFSRHMLPAKTS